jgi:3'-5' exoribonuclease-like protein
MKFFYDTEFIENGSTIDLISIGMVCDDGREFYLQNMDCQFDNASEWVQANVFPALIDFDCGDLLATWKDRTTVWMPHDRIGNALLGFVEGGNNSKAEFWGYYADYDHVALCQLFGTMMDLPKGFPMYTRDLKQWCDQLGNPKLPEQGKGEHHALADARWNKRVYDFLESKEFLSAKA